MKLIRNSTSLIKVTVTIPANAEDSNSISTIKKPIFGYSPMQYVLTYVEIPIGKADDKVALLAGNNRNTLHAIRKDGTEIEVQNGDVIDPVITFGKPYIAVRNMAETPETEALEIVLTLSQI